MDVKKQPGLKFEKIFLSKLKYELPKEKPNEFKYTINFENSYKITGNNKLIYVMGVKLYDRFELEVTGVFSTIKGEENISLKEFAERSAPAIMLPFVREVISNFTARTPLPHILLPPINVRAIREAKK